MKSLSKICIFWTDRAILAALLSHSALLYNTNSKNVARCGTYEREKITNFFAKKSQTLQGYFKIMQLQIKVLASRDHSESRYLFVIWCADFQINPTRTLLVPLTQKNVTTPLVYDRNSSTYFSVTNLFVERPSLKIIARDD